MPASRTPSPIGSSCLAPNPSVTTLVTVPLGARVLGRPRLERLGEPAPADLADERIGGDLWLERGSHVGDDPEGPCPAVLPGRVIQQHEPAPSDLDPGYLDRRANRGRVRRQPTWRRLAVEAELGPSLALMRPPPASSSATAARNAGSSPAVLVRRHRGGPQRAGRRHGMLTPRGRASPAACAGRGGQFPAQRDAPRPAARFRIRCRTTQGTSRPRCRGSTRSPADGRWTNSRSEPQPDSRGSHQSSAAPVALASLPPLETL